MSKKLVRIEIDVWGGGPTIAEYPIVKETEHVVFIVRERERKNPETGLKEKIRVAGPFNRKDIGVICCSNQRMIRGAKRMYIVSAYEHVTEDPMFWHAVNEMCSEIYGELTAAGRMLADIWCTFTKSK